MQRFPRPAALSGGMAVLPRVLSVVQLNSVLGNARLGRVRRLTSIQAFGSAHHSGEGGLYHDVQMREPVASTSGGGSFETCTIVMRNQTFIPIPDPLRQAFMPSGGETKRLEVRCDLLYMDPERN